MYLNLLVQSLSLGGERRHHCNEAWNGKVKNLIGLNIRWCQHFPSHTDVSCKVTDEGHESNTVSIVFSVIDWTGGFFLCA